MYLFTLYYMTVVVCRTEDKLKTEVLMVWQVVLFTAFISEAGKYPSITRTWSNATNTRISKLKVRTTNCELTCQ